MEEEWLKHDKGQFLRKTIADMVSNRYFAFDLYASKNGITVYYEKYGQGETRENVDYETREQWTKFWRCVAPVQNIHINLIDGWRRVLMRFSWEIAEVCHGNTNSFALCDMEDPSFVGYLENVIEKFWKNYRDSWTT